MNNEVNLLQELTNERRDKNRLMRELKARDGLIFTYKQNAVFQEKLYNMVKKQKDAQEVFLGLMLDKSPDLIVLIDTERRFISGTKNNLSKLGIDADALTGKDFMIVLSAVLSPESHDRLYASLREAMTKGEALEYSANTALKNGQAYIHKIAVIPFLNESGGIIGAMIQIYDITELLKNAEHLPEMISMGTLTLDLISHRALINGEDLILTKKEFAVLRLLAQNEGKPMSAEAIYEKIWGQPMAGDKNALQVSITRLRKKIEPAGYVIASAHGQGYVFERN